MSLIDWAKEHPVLAGLVGVGATLATGYVLYRLFGEEASEYREEMEALSEQTKDILARTDRELDDIAEQRFEDDARHVNDLIDEWQDFKSDCEEQFEACSDTGGLRRYMDEFLREIDRQIGRLQTRLEAC